MRKQKLKIKIKKHSRGENYNNCNENLLGGFKSKFEQAEVRISEVEDWTMEIIKSEE